jgi:hypothetical protein
MVPVIYTLLRFTQSFSPEKLCSIITPVRVISMLSEYLIEVEIRRISCGFSSRVSNKSPQIEMFSYLHCFMSTHPICFRCHFKHFNSIKPLWLRFMYLTLLHFNNLSLCNAKYSRM